MAFIPMLEAVLHPLMLYQPIWVIGFTVALGKCGPKGTLRLLADDRAVQQFVLSHGLMDYVLTAPRTSLISHNKEGIISLPGPYPFPRQVIPR